MRSKLLASILMPLLFSIVLTACSGVPGPQGSSGAQGYVGDQGIKGDKGDIGSQGVQGAAGVSVLMSTAGATPDQCYDGGTVVTYSFSDGSPGGSFAVCDGEEGLRGLSGSKGTDGQDATPVTTLQLCPDDTSTLPEYALVMPNGQMYAVYYAPPNVGLTLLVPGTYRSTMGNGCTFTVEVAQVVTP